MRGFSPCNASGEGRGGRGGGRFSGIVPGGLGPPVPPVPPVPPRRPTVSQTIQRYNSCSDNTPPSNPPKSPLILFIQPTPPCDPPPPTSALDTGSGDIVFVSHSRVKARWVCSATVFNKSEHIYGTKSSARSSFTAIFRSEWRRVINYPKTSPWKNIFSRVTHNK